MAKNNGTMPLSKYVALLKYRRKTEKQIASTLGISPERVVQLLKEARAELDDQQQAAVSKMVDDDHFPASLAASLVRLGDEKRTEELLILWRAKEINVHEATRMIEGALTEKVKEMRKDGKSQVEIGLKLGLSQPAVSYRLSKKINMFDAIAVAIGSGEEIEGTSMTQHSRERLVQAGVMRKDEFGYYILTDEFIDKIVAAANKCPNSFLFLCLIKVMGFDKLREEEVQAKIVQLVAQIVKAKDISLTSLTPAFNKMQNQNIKAPR